MKNYFLWNYYYASVREPKIKYLEWNPQFTEIIKELKKNDFNVIDYKINLNDYKQFLKNAKYHLFPKYYLTNLKRGALYNKSVEHYLASKFLNLCENDIYIDVATCDSPAPEIYNDLYKCKVYRQDLIFPEGIRGNIIGGDACDMPLKDGFATKMALHCSFEHFERDSDMKFIKEANRVLKKGGKLCIVPLLLYQRYCIKSNCSFLTEKTDIFDNDAIVYCAKYFLVRFSRYYDISHLITRIKHNLKNLNLTIFVIQNEKEIHLSCNVKFVALFEKQ